MKNPQGERPCPIVSPTTRVLAKQNKWPEQGRVSDLVAPFELSQENNNKGILLLHGLTDSPYVFHDLAAFYHQQGFTVRTLLLPGHGTAASDLIDVDVEQWRTAASYGIGRMLLDFEQVYLGGFSTGGALILDYLMAREDVDDKVSGVFLWSPASKASSDLAWLARYVDAIPFVDWLGKEADTDFAKYESFPFNAGAQVHALMASYTGENARKNRTLHNIPLFVVAGEHDQTINTQATLALLNEWHQPNKRQRTSMDTLIYYGSKSVASSSLPDKFNLVVPDCLAGQLCQSVYDVAHTAPTNSPDNLHYGTKGKYRNCGHYQTDMEKFRQCKQGTDVIVGERTEINLNLDKPLQRLTYNPFFQEMLEEISLFLKKTSGIQG